MRNVGRIEKVGYMMESQPLVSVIVPMYNVEKYLCACIESIIQQTYKKLEIIIVNDGSTDHCADIAEKYAKQDSRIHLVYQANKGVASARNAGLDLSTGDFILFVDSDDWITNDHVEYLLMLQHMEDADMCMTTEFYTQTFERQTYNEKIVTMSSEEAAALLLSPKVIVGSYNKLYRREWLIKNKIRQDESLFSGEGLHFIVTAAQYANYVTVSNKRIYYYRRNVPQSATTKFNINMFLNNEKCLDILEEKKIISNKHFDNMLSLFRVHLMISGLLAIQIYASPEEYSEIYSRWKRQIFAVGKKLLAAGDVPLRSKIRILGVGIFPKLWAQLAKAKRKRIFIKSV